MTTIVYKYRMWNPTKNAELVDQTFIQADEYYNTLASIENRRRFQYRTARARILPQVKEQEDKYEDLQHQIDQILSQINESKKLTRSRNVPSELATQLGALKKSANQTSELLSSAIAKGKNHPDLLADANIFDAEAAEASTELRSTLYWGTYMLVEDAIKRAKKDQPGWLAKKEAPLHQRHGRIGIQIHSGLTLSELLHVPGDWRIQLEAPGLERPDNLQSSNYRADLATIKKQQVAKWQEVQDRVPEIGELRMRIAGAQERRQSIKDQKKTFKNDKDRCKSLTTNFTTVTIEIQHLSAELKTAIAANKKLLREAIKAIDLETKAKRKNCKSAYSAKIANHPDKFHKLKGFFRLRVGSNPDGTPLLGEFPILLHRPLPADAIISWAVVTRQPGHLYRPWIYHLCLTIDTQTHARTALPTQQGTVAINFGWRQIEDTLRVATLNKDSNTPEHICLPPKVYQRFDRCVTLRSTIATQFNEAKAELVKWIASNKNELPTLFLEDFALLANWRSTRRLSDLVGYWRDHRLPGDEAVFGTLWHWRGRWIHLYQWEICNYRKALRARTDFYENLAVRIAQNSAQVVIEDFKISQVAERTPTEEKNVGGQKARENRTRAAVGELRSIILHACAKHHCGAQLVKSSNNTRKCNVCGQIFKWDPARELVRTCPNCSEWDQDVNNTNNIHDRVANGETTILVTPAKGGDEAKIETFIAAHKQLSKKATTKSRLESDPPTDPTR